LAVFSEGLLSLSSRPAAILDGQKSSSVLKEADLHTFVQLFYLVMRNLGLIRAIFGAVLGFEWTFFR